jgi:alanine racemase
MYPIPTVVVADAAAAGIAVTVGDLDGLREALAALDGGRGRGRGGSILEFELEVDTGLGRGGLLPRDVEAAVGVIEASPNARLRGLWTHLQASEDPDRTAVQLGRFDAVWSWAWSRPGSVGVTRSVAASGGLLTSVAGLDVVRPGLSVYGIVPDELEAASLDRAIVERFRPVMSLHAQPVRVADVAPGDGVSYGPTWRAARPSRVATLPLGYGDGFARAHSNRGHVLVRGQRAPIVGNVAMDAVLVDVTDVPGEPVTTGDGFVLLGEQDGSRIAVEELARQRTTNTWEVVTAMAARLPRVYHAASAPVGLRTLTERRG